MKIAAFYHPSSSTTKSLEPLADASFRFSSQIGLSPNAVFIEIGRSHRLFTETSFILKSRVLLKRFELNAQIGLGDTVTHALIRAKYKTNDLASLPLGALSDFFDPLRNQLEQKNHVLKMIDSLQVLGLRTLADFKKIPRREVASRFGAMGLLTLYRMDGESDVAWPKWSPPEIIIESHEYLNSDFQGLLEPILFELKSILDRIFSRLWARGLAACRLKLKIQTEKFPSNTRPLREFDFQFLMPQVVTKGTLNILKERLSKDLEKAPLSFPVEKIEIQITDTLPRPQNQRNLMKQSGDEMEDRSTLLSQLKERLGDESVFQASLVEERLPELSWVKVKPDSTFADIDLSILPERPLHLLKPRRIELTAGTLYISSRPYKIVFMSSAERITTHALGGNIDRNYFHITVENGPRLWVFQNAAGEYYLHGYF